MDEWEIPLMNNGPTPGMSDPEVGTAHQNSEAAAVKSYKDHLLHSINSAAVGEDPFFHTYLEDVFPHELYDCIRKYMLEKKYGEDVQDRLQDNPAFKNSRFNLEFNKDEIPLVIRALFSDPEVKQALLAKFYVDPSPALVNALEIHKEFEFFFTKAGRFQNIHVDIPPKFLSFVFYIPEKDVDPEDELRNGTILYDKKLLPHYKARFKANSACVFVPHFSTYHGFSSTIDRDVLVMFYINKDELQNWRTMRKEVGDVPPFSGLLDAIEAKLKAHPLIEFSKSEHRLQEEKAACLVNAPDGRVMRPDI